MINSVDVSNLKLICLKLDYNYEMLGGNNLSDKIISLINFFDKRGRKNELEEVYLMLSNQKNKNSKIKIYFSYAWDDSYNENSREQEVDNLYKILSDKGFDVRRDKMNIGYKDLISEFMEEIGESQNIIVALSDKYLKSPYCMFELYEIYRNSKQKKKEFIKKIYPIHLEKLNLKDPITLKNYLEYWENKQHNWEDLIKTQTSNIGNETFSEYRKIKDILANFSEIIAFIMDINALSLEFLSKNDYTILIEYIEKKIAPDNLYMS